MVSKRQKFIDLYRAGGGRKDFIDLSGHGSSKKSTVERIGREKRTSVYKYPKKGRSGKTYWYKSLSAFGTGASPEYLASIDPFPEGSAAQKAFIKDLKKQFKYPLNSNEAKVAGVLGKEALAKKHGITFKQLTIQTEKYKKLKKLKYPSPPYEGKEYKKFKQAERRGFITKTSKPVVERKISELFSKKGVQELGHRASLRQLAKLGAYYSVGDLGFDTSLMNQELVKPFENKLEALYAQQNKIADKYKNRAIPVAAQKELSAINNKIMNTVEETQRNLKGVLMNEKTGKFASVYGQEASKAPGAGLINKLVKDVVPADLDLMKLNIKEQTALAIRNEKRLIDQLPKIPKKITEILEKRVNCASGCLAQVAKNEPGKITKAIETLPQKARGFLGMLGRGGARAAPLAALAAVGAAAEPLVKQFISDDPNTYLTNENQMKGMLLATLEGETPKVDDEILKWQNPALAGATVAGAVPGAGEVYRSRRGLPPNIPGKYGAANKFIGPMEKGVGPARAALGIKGVLGKALGASFSPLAVAATLPMKIAAQQSGGTDLGDIATDPTNWMGPAFAASGAEMASKGIKNPLLLKALRMGMSPRTLSMVSRRFGMPGLAVSAGMWGYDKWKNRSVNDDE